MTVLTATNDADGMPSVLCVICLRSVPMSDVTAGSCYADGHPAFACALHLNDRTRWIVEWSLFDARQRQLKAATDIAVEELL